MALLLLAAALVIFRRDGPADEVMPESSPLATKSRSRGAVSGSTAERMDRIRTIWRSTAGSHATPEDLKVALELVQSLPAASLKELIGEFIGVVQDEGDPEMLRQMAQRIGDLEAERGLKWLADEAAHASGDGPYEFLFRPAIDGWSRGDPVGLLGAYFDDDKSLLFRIRDPSQTAWGQDGIGPGIVKQAAARDPDEVWRLLRTWQRETMADEFFDGLDPTLAAHFSKRIKELFRDPDRPGFEFLGGDAESWQTEQQVRKAAGSAWFISQPDEAIAWTAEQSVGGDAPPDSRERDLGTIAGALSSRLYQVQPDRALAWISAKPADFRSAASAELGYEILALPGLPDEGIADLRVLAGWIGEGSQRARWLGGLPAALTSRDRGDRLREAARILTDQLDLSAAERSIVEAHLR